MIKMPTVPATSSRPLLLSGAFRSPPGTSRTRAAPSLSRPELFRLLNDAQPGDILLVEQVDRLSRLTTGDWEKLKAELTARRRPRCSAGSADLLDDGDLKD